MLTGWAGQLSLGQMAFAGVGALLTAAFTRGLNFDIRIGDTRLLKAGVEPLRFGPSVVFAALITAGIAVLIGVGALRVRGLFLAVVTFAFALAATQYLYDRPILSGGFSDSVPLPRTDVFGIDVTSQRSFYYVTLAVLAVVVVVVARLRASGVGRTTIAVRDNPDTAAAYTVSTTRTKLRAFALAGGLAALGGALLAANIQAVPSDRYFTVDDSLLVVSMVVIGGLGSVAGADLGAVWVIGLPAFFPDNDLVPLLTSSIGLLVLLMYFPGGLDPDRLRRRAGPSSSWLEKRLGPAPAKQRHAVPKRTAEERAPLDAGVPALRAHDVVVRFGGNTAVDHVSIDVADGEVVGLIGTNGAGKSTLMNAIGGFVPSTGTVELLGSSISGKSAAGRARLGLGRTFQAATLFPELTVRDTVLVALEGRGRTGMLSTALFSPVAIKRERRAPVGGRASSSTSSGSAATPTTTSATSRPAPGGSSSWPACSPSTHGSSASTSRPPASPSARPRRSGPLILEMRRELGASMLIIEHDMPLIMGISDRVYCLEAGPVIAEGDPSTVRNRPAGDRQLPRHRRAGHRPQRRRRPPRSWTPSPPPNPSSFRRGARPGPAAPRRPRRPPPRPRPLRPHARACRSSAPTATWTPGRSPTTSPSAIPPSSSSPGTTTCCGCSTARASRSRPSAPDPGTTSRWPTAGARGARSPSTTTCSGPRRRSSGWTTPCPRSSASPTRWARTTPTPSTTSWSPTSPMTTFRPRALYERFGIEFLATTDAALSDLDAHARIRASGWSGRVVPTFRPDDVVDPDRPDFGANLDRLAKVTGEDTTTWDGYLAALRARRADFVAAGPPPATTATRRRSPPTCPGPRPRCSSTGCAPEAPRRATPSASGASSWSKWRP